MSKTKQEERRDVAVAMLAALMGNRAPGSVIVSDIQKAAMVDVATQLADALLEHLKETAPREDGD